MPKMYCCVNSGTRFDRYPSIALSGIVSLFINWILSLRNMHTGTGFVSCSPESVSFKFGPNVKLK